MIKKSKIKTLKGKTAGGHRQKGQPNTNSYKPIAWINKKKIAKTHEYKNKTRKGKKKNRIISFKSNLSTK